MYCTAPRGDIWETFSIVNAGGGKVALMNMGKFVSSENGSVPMTCNRTTIGAWEQFDYLINSDGTISLRGNNGLFITAEDGTKPMICNRAQIGAWEKFKAL
jgi:glucosylceramidase